MPTRDSTPLGTPVNVGVDLPDGRGRTGLDQAGSDLSRNPDVVVRDAELVASSWHVLWRASFDYRHADGTWTREARETYDRGNGATVLPYDTDRGTVLLTRQFRYPAYVNDHPDGMLVEAAAGLLDGDDAETAIRHEALGLADDGEDIQVLEVAFTEALDVVDTGAIADAKTIMLLQWAALRGPFRTRPTEPAP